MQGLPAEATIFRRERHHTFHAQETGKYAKYEELRGKYGECGGKYGRGEGKYGKTKARNGKGDIEYFA